jgi:hypothetical protein
MTTAMPLAASNSILPILLRRMSGDALTMDNKATSYFLRQFLGCQQARGNVSATERFDEMPSAQTGDLSPPAQQDQGATE